MIQIRPMQLNESEPVLGLWNENCMEAAGRFLTDAEANQVLANLRQYANHPEVFCLVAVAEDGLCGFVTAGAFSHPVMPGRTGEIEELYVRDDVRRSGVGAKLVEEAVAKLQMMGADVIRSQAAADASLVRQFWQALDWERDLEVFSLYLAVPA